jgi:hypothetical protein
MTIISKLIEQRATIAGDLLESGEIRAIMRILVKKALEGDIRAARIVLDELNWTLQNYHIVRDYEDRDESNPTTAEMDKKIAALIGDI